MSAVERQKYLQQITQRLIMFTGSVLIVAAFFLYIVVGSDWFGNTDHSYLVLIVFVCGLLGGFVSIQQRLPTITLEELKILSDSWVSITLIPVNGGIFAIVLMLMFLGKIIQGQLFPVYPDGIAITSVKTFNEWLTSSYPATGTEVAKLLFWSFVAGFSERFVPQIIRRTTDEVEKSTEEKNQTNENNTTELKKVDQKVRQVE